MEDIGELSRKLSLLIAFVTFFFLIQPLACIWLARHFFPDYAYSFGNYISIVVATFIVRASLNPWNEKGEDD